VGLVLAWPLYDATVAARTDRSRVLEGVADDERDVVWAHVAASVQQAYVDVVAARDALPVLERAKAAGIANYMQASARFKGGMGDAVELADAEDVRTTAEIELALGSFELSRARAGLARLIGVRP
jgi:outer membrane protein TolC